METITPESLWIHQVSLENEILYIFFKGLLKSPQKEYLRKE